MCQKKYKSGTDAPNNGSKGGRILFRQQIQREEKITPATGTFELSQTFFRSLSKKWPAPKGQFCEADVEEDRPEFVKGSFRWLSILNCQLRITIILYKIVKDIIDHYARICQGKNHKKAQKTIEI